MDGISELNRTLYKISDQMNIIIAKMDILITRMDLDNGIYKFDPILLLPIIDLKLYHHEVLMFESQNVDYVGDLIQLTEDDLTKYHISPYSRNNIKIFLAEHGLKFETKVTYWKEIRWQEDLRRMLLIENL